MKKSLLGFFAGLTMALLLTLLAGENPLQILGILFRSAFGSNYDFGLTLFYTVPLIFTGLSVALALQAGLLNVGAEGQLLVAATTAAGVGVLWPQLPFPFAPLFALSLAILAGACWGGLAGWLRASRGSHEVIVTMMLNFVAAGLCSWFVLEKIPNPQSQNPESALISESYQFKAWDPFVHWFPDTGLSWALPMALICCLVMWIVLRKTPWGFELRAVGANPEAARRSGIPVERRQIQALALAGALAGGVALSEVLGHSGQLKIGFSPDYGFIGIAVALLARNRPALIPFAALLIAALHKGASDLDLETESITRDFSKVIQALIILGVAFGGLAWRRRKKETT